MGNIEGSGRHDLHDLHDTSDEPVPPIIEDELVKLGKEKPGINLKELATARKMRSQVNYIMKQRKEREELVRREIEDDKKRRNEYKEMLNKQLRYKALLLSAGIGPREEKKHAQLRKQLEDLEKKIQENECSVCREYLQPNRESLVKLKCNHKYHLKCILDWIQTCKRSGSPENCPMCRGALVFGHRRRSGKRKSKRKSKRKCH